MGFLMGTAFAVAQAIFSLPMGRLADRINRRTFLAVALAVWSVATAISGLASSFIALLIARFVVGAAEAAQILHTPRAWSAISSARINRAVRSCSVPQAWHSGLPFGSYAGGTLNDLYSWNVALFVVGLPGLVVAGSSLPDCSRAAACRAAGQAFVCRADADDAPAAETVPSPSGRCRHSFSVSPPCVAP